LDPTAIVIAVVQKNTRLKVPRECDPVVAKIINSVWKANPDKRMKMKTIVDLLNDYHETLQSVYDRITNYSEDDEEASFLKEKPLEAYFLPSGDQVSVEGSGLEFTDLSKPSTTNNSAVTIDSYGFDSIGEKGKEKFSGESTEKSGKSSDMSYAEPFVLDNKISKKAKKGKEDDAEKSQKSTDSSNLVYAEPFTSTSGESSSRTVSRDPWLSPRRHYDSGSQTKKLRQDDSEDDSDRGRKSREQSDLSYAEPFVSGIGEKDKQKKKTKKKKTKKGQTGGITSYSMPGSD